MTTEDWVCDICRVGLSEMVLTIDTLSNNRTQTNQNTNTTNNSDNIIISYIYGK